MPPAARNQEENPSTLMAQDDVRQVIPEALVEGIDRS
jgi:hypothetical protein